MPKLKKYKIYAGLGGGFGGARYMETEEFKNEDKAMDYAYELAVQEYENFAGYHGLRDKDQMIEEDGLDSEDEENIELAYREEMESWISYHVKLDDGVEEE